MEGQWRFLALVIQPDGLYQREQDGNAVSELGWAEVVITPGQWHTACIELGGEGSYTTVVKHLHSAIGYVSPLDMLEGRQKEIHQARDQKPEAAREKRREARQLNREATIA